MTSSFFQRIIILLLCASFAVPLYVYSAEDDTETLKQLQAQIAVLTNIVLELQQTLLSHISGQHQTETLSSQEIQGVIREAVRWLQNAQKEDGHFKYEYVPYEGVYLNDDNIVRQAGALYALGEVLRRDHDNMYELRENMERSISFFEKQTVLGTLNDISFRCVANSPINHRCQLGTTGLVLIGILDLIERYPELEGKYQKLAEDYANYIIAMKKEDEGFRNTFSPGADLAFHESSFANGEALLALARFYKYAPSPDVKEVLFDTFTYFEANPHDYALYLWAMAGLKDMQELFSDERYATYAREFTDWRINGFGHYRGSGYNVCAYIEGVISAYSVFEHVLSGEERVYYLDEIHYWLRESKKLQVTKQDIFRVHMHDNRGVFLQLQDPARATGGFLTGRDTLTQRIDFTQHCVNSYTQYLVDIAGEAL